MLNYIISLSEQPVTVEVDPNLIRPVDTPVICCDHSRITEKLGWIPEYGVFEAVREMFDDYSYQAGKAK